MSPAAVVSVGTTLVDRKRKQYLSLFPCIQEHEEHDEFFRTTTSLYNLTQKWWLRGRAGMRAGMWWWAEATAL